MPSTRSALRHWGIRTMVVGATLAGMTAFSTAVAINAAAVVKSPGKLCAPHGGVEYVGKNFVECADGEVFEFDYPI